VDSEPPEPQAVPQGTVLIVEDDSKVAEVSESLIQQIGYNTIVAADAREALDLLARQKDIVLVFTDIIMPGKMDGIQLARMERENHPNLPVLLTTGYARMAETVGGEFPILRKPYELSALARAVRSAIDASAATV